MTKFEKFLEDKQMKQIQTLKLYTNWYIEDIPQYRTLAQGLMKLQKLKLVTIITRHPIKSTESFSDLKERIEIDCEEWEQKHIVIE